MDNNEQLIEALHQMSDNTPTGMFQTIHTNPAGVQMYLAIVDEAARALGVLFTAIEDPFYSDRDRTMPHTEYLRYVLFLDGTPSALRNLVVCVGRSMATHGYGD